MPELPAQVLNHPAFCSLGKDSQLLLAERASFRNFGVGSTLSTGTSIPSEIFLILTGEVRLLTSLNCQIISLLKLTSNSFVGLASLLSAHPCEHTISSTDGSLVSIPDDLILQLYHQESSFFDWCATTSFLPEINALLQRVNPPARITPTSIEDYKRHVIEAHQHSIASCELPKDSSSSQVFVASSNIDSLPIYTQVDQSTSIRVQPPLSPRFLAIPSNLILLPSSSSSALSEAPLVSTDSSDCIDHLEPPIPSGLVLNANDTHRPRLLRAHGAVNELLASLQMLAWELDLPFRRDAIQRILTDFLQQGHKPDLRLVSAITSSMGLLVSQSTVEASHALRLRTPSFILTNDGPCIVYKSNATGLHLASPRIGYITINPSQLVDYFPERIELLHFELRQITARSRFGFAWFWPFLKRYKTIFAQVFLASLVVQLFGLANPLLIQVIIDKVISQRSLDTLQVLGFALVAVTLFEGILSSLRTFLFAETTNRIDLRLGAEVIDHLLRLPLGYFDRRPVGELSSRLSELEKIREFITGQALTSLLDAIFSILYIVVMLFYSLILSIVALSVLPIQIAITFLGAPLFRRQFRDAAHRNALTQSHLVEILSGIQTVKAQNVETVSRWKWQSLYSSYISSAFSKTLTSTALSQASQIFQKISQLLVLWVGASLVLKGELTLGQLIAFRIISGYVTQPLLRLSTIWQSVQELKISLERLSDVIDTPTESNEVDQTNMPQPTISGSVRFDDVTFNFEGSTRPSLSHVSLSVSPGSFVGIVGQSGSGKSTLTKMLSRLYSPSSGSVYLDDIDISKVELYSLRRQIGIVPQEPLLFSGSVSENISLINPDAEMDSIVNAARVACAHDFIMSLPDGYATQVGERGSNLSGGQRQRVALARTLLSKPKLLILDEATSALDFDTESRLCRNLMESLSGSTVFFVTHRLPTVKDADSIIVMRDGSIAESGTHQQLLEAKGVYFALLSKQSDH